eukprot:10947215-Lingulodinium_polyedra.AAC.1
MDFISAPDFMSIIDFHGPTPAGQGVRRRCVLIAALAFWHAPVQQGHAAPTPAGQAVRRRCVVLTPTVP